MHAPRSCTTCTLRRSFRIAICARSPHNPGQGSPGRRRAPPVFQGFHPWMVFVVSWGSKGVVQGFAARWRQRACSTT